MWSYIIRRFLLTIPVIFVVSSVTFLLMHAIPGGPFSEEKALPPEIIKNLEKKYHLDDPLWKQYIDYMWGFIRFDFGPSITYKTRTVNDILAQQWPPTAILGSISFFFAILVGVVLGVISAVHANTLIDYGCMTVAVIGVSMPNIVIGPLLIWIFALNLKWLPVARWGTPAHVVLPALTLSAPYIARFARFTRAAILEVLNEEYVRTARAKGLSERLTIIRHVLRNALIPVITVAGPTFAGIITGSMVVEQIFAIPGIGKYYVTSVNNRDYPVIMTFTLIFAFCIIMMNLLVDILYAIIDPRIRYT